MFVLCMLIIQFHMLSKYDYIINYFNLLFFVSKITKQTLSF